MALGPDRVPENQKREVYERVRRAVEAKAGACTSHKVCNLLCVARGTRARTVGAQAFFRRVLPIRGATRHPRTHK